MSGDPAPTTDALKGRPSTTPPSIPKATTTTMVSATMQTVVPQHPRGNGYGKTSTKENGKAVLPVKFPFGDL